MVVGFLKQDEPSWPSRSAETPAERDARIRHEAEIIARAHADIDAGLGIGDEALEAWLDELNHDPDAPIPTPSAGPRR